MKPETTNNNNLKATSSQLLYICKLDPSLNIESLKDLSVTAASKMIYRLKADKRTATNTTKAPENADLRKETATPKEIIKEVIKTVEKPIIKEVEKIIYRDFNLAANKEEKTQIDAYKENYILNSDLFESIKDDEKILFAAHGDSLIKHLLTALEYTATAKNSRYLLKTINILGSKENNKITITATDSYSLYSVCIAAAVHNDFNINIEPETIRKNAADFKKFNNCIITLSKEGIMAAANNKIIIKFVDGEYPNVKSAIQYSNYNNITNNLSIEVLEKMLKAAKKTGSKTITFYGGFVEGNKAFNYGLDGTEAVMMAAPCKR